MTQLEDMLRTAFHEKAGYISGQAPPLDLESADSPLAARRVDGSSRGKARRRWLIPVAAAAAVLAVVAGTTITSGVLTPAGSRATSSGLSGVPRYYVALALEGKPKDQKMIAVVRETQTGAVVATVAAPQPYVTFAEVTGAANDRTFVLEAQEAGQPNTTLLPAYRFYLLRVNPAGASAASRVQLTPLRLPIPDQTQPVAIALSPDGLLLATITMTNPVATRVIVYNLATHVRHTWTDPTCETMPCIGGGFGYAPDILSWTSDSRELAVDSHGARPPNTLRLLDVSAPGSNLLADSRLVPLHGAPVVGGMSLLDDSWRVVQLAPDGKSVFIGVQYDNEKLRETLLRFSVQTGALISVLNKLSIKLPHHHFNNWEQLLWSNSSGSTLILAYTRRGATAGIRHGRTYTSIPWSSAIQDAAW
jgi:hypothetical protein